MAEDADKAGMRPPHARVRSSRKAVNGASFKRDANEAVVSPHYIYCKWSFSWFNAFSLWFTGCFAMMFIVGSLETVRQHPDTAACASSCEVLKAYESMQHYKKK